MRDEAAITRAPSASSPTALALGTVCLGAAVVALLASRREVRFPNPLARKTVVPAQAGIHAERDDTPPSFLARTLKTVVPAQAGIHAERDDTQPSFLARILRTVVPAEAGTHAESADTLPNAQRPSDQAFYGSPPARGRRAGGVGQDLEAGALRAQHGSRPSPGRRVDAGDLNGAASPRTRRRLASRHAVDPRGLYHAASLLALSVLLDSAVEHYRGRFENPGMFAPLATSLATTLIAVRATPNTAIYATALATGAAGSAFHIYNVSRRPGGFCWQNLFYAAPLGAPAALCLAGILGLAAQRTQRRSHDAPNNRVLCAIAGIGMAGSAAEAALLHFRGAYHRPAMWLPVTVPPIGAIFLLRAAAGARDRLARAWLGLTALLGVAGVAFHANGIAKQMGGWSNWRQNVLSGPPLPAPPSFLALALAGRAALAPR